MNYAYVPLLYPYIHPFRHAFLPSKEACATAFSLGFPDIQLSGTTLEAFGVRSLLAWQL